MPQTLGASVYSTRTSRRYCPPFVYALLPGKSQEVYTAIWDQIRSLVGEGAGAERLVTMDFGRSGVSALEATPPYAAAAGCYFHLGKSVYRGSMFLV